MAALTTANVRKEALGGLRTLVLDFSSSVGEADATLAVMGRHVFSSFQAIDGGTGTQMELPFTISESSGIVTYTINVSQGVTKGRALIMTN